MGCGFLTVLCLPSTLNKEFLSLFQTPTVSRSPWDPNLVSLPSVLRISRCRYHGCPPKILLHHVTFLLQQLGGAL